MFESMQSPSEGRAFLQLILPTTKTSAMPGGFLESMSMQLQNLPADDVVLSAINGRFSEKKRAEP